MTPDEVRMLDNRLALLFIRGEPPLMDEKYDLLKHPYVKYTTDGGAPAFTHGGYGKRCGGYGYWPALPPATWKSQGAG